jgi:RNA polymerase sigma-70 factor (ECF subfamily)
MFESAVTRSPAAAAIPMKRDEMHGPVVSNLDALAPPSSELAPQFQCDLVALIPQLRAFARMLCGKRAIAEDMAQEALAKAWRARGSFVAGTNLKAWLFTILRNEVYSHARRAWREMPWDEAEGNLIAAPANEQESAMNLSDTARALRGLPDCQREALILIAAGGFSYEDAARVCGTPVGTVKSRVARARSTLAKILDDNKPMPRYTASGLSASEDILSQLSALASAGAHGADALS